VSLKELFRLIKSDIHRRMKTDGIDRTVFGLLKTVLMPSSIAVIIFRLEHYFYKKRIHVLTKIFALLNLILFSTEIQAACEIDEGFIIGHANGILIHENSRIGKNCTLMHQAIIGLRERPGVPVEKLRITVGDGVLIGAGARILGPLAVGDFCEIGMNAVVTLSLPSYSVAVGIPAKVIKKLEKKNEKRSESGFPRKPCVESATPDNDREELTLKKTIDLFRQDLRNRAYIDGKPFKWNSYFKFWFNPTVLAVLVYRMQHLAHVRKIDFISKVLNILNVVLFKVEIGSKARIGGGLVLGHSHGIIINNDVIIGKNCVFFHDNTVAIGPREDLDPQNDKVVIGDEVMVGAGARILGNISVGDHSIIGMNAVVTRSVPPCSVVAGVPGRVIRQIRAGSGPETGCREEDSGVSTAFSETGEEEEKLTFRKTLKLAKSDIKYRYELEHKKFNAFSYIKVLFNPPALATVIFRFQHWFWSVDLYPVAKLLALLNIMLFSVEIGSGAQIDEGLVLAHSIAIVIHERVQIGKRCIFTAHNTVSIGPLAFGDVSGNRIILGNDVFLGVGARIVGNLTIGDRSQIGMNAVVTKSFPANSRLIGVPARPV